MLLAAFDRGARGMEHGPRFLFPLFLMALLTLLFVLMRRRRHAAFAGAYRHGRGSPRQTLEDRFARGEIDQDEFEHRRAVLDRDEVIPPAPTRSAPPAPSADGDRTMSAEPLTDPVDETAEIDSDFDDDNGTA